MIQLNKLLHGALRRAGIEREVTAAQMVDGVNEALTEVFGDGILAHMRCVSVSRDTMSLVCAHATLAHEARLRRADIVAALARRVPTSGVERLAVRASDGSSAGVRIV